MLTKIVRLKELKYGDVVRCDQFAFGSAEYPGNRWIEVGWPSENDSIFGNKLDAVDLTRGAAQFMVLFSHEINSNGHYGPEVPRWEVVAVRLSEEENSPQELIRFIGGCYLENSLAEVTLTGRVTGMIVIPLSDEASPR